VVSTFEQGLKRWRGVWVPLSKLRGFGAFGKMKCIFSIMSEAELKRRQSHRSETLTKF